MCTMKLEKFEEYFLRYKNIVIRMVMKKTGDYQLAQEICQQVFVSLYLNYNTVPDDLVKAWLMRCTQNAIIDFHRKIHAKKHRHSEDTLDVLEEGNVVSATVKVLHIEESMYNKELTGRILREVKAVNELWYEALTMICIDGLTYAEAAERLNVTSEVMRARVYRARTYIRERFGKEYEE